MYKPQSEFPYLQEFSKFPIDENTVFCLRTPVYSDLEKVFRKIEDFIDN